MIVKVDRGISRLLYRGVRCILIINPSFIYLFQQGVMFLKDHENDEKEKDIAYLMDLYKTTIEVVGRNYAKNGNI